MLFRRKHKKGQEEEQTKKRTRRAQKFQRAIVGASLTDILAKRNMKPEIRKAQREQAIKYVFFQLLFSVFQLLKNYTKRFHYIKVMKLNVIIFYLKINMQNI